MSELIQKYDVTSSTQLIDLSKKFKFKLNFVGFTDDLTARELRSSNLEQVNGKSYIFNICDTAGTHWTPGYVKDNVMFYFDSFAVPPEDDLIHILEKNSTIKTIIYNSNFQFQNIDEELCGIWCVIFLYHMNYSKLPTLIERFDEFKKRYKNLN